MQVDTQQQSELRLSSKVIEDGVQVVIEDTGEGIPDHMRLRVFEPFFSSRPRHAGLGLATVQEIVNLHSGTVQIDPNYSKGCRIVVRFPVISPA